MLAGIVLLSFIRKALTFPQGRKIFALDVRDDDGNEHHLIGIDQPNIFDADGHPIALATELSAGSRVIIDNDGRIVRAIQVIEHVFANPFAEVTRRP